MTSSSFRLSLLLPAFNEESRLGPTIDALTTHFDSHQLDYEILVIDDGSTDDTADIARAAGATVIRHPENLGKGAALRSGVQAAKGQSIVFTDADLAYSPSMIDPILSLVEGDIDMAVGSRRHPQSQSTSRRGLLRWVGGMFVSLLTRALVLPEIRDTQCGIKGFRRSVAKDLFGRSRVDGFAVDVELFALAHRDQLRVAEVPVSVANRSCSSVRLVTDTVDFAAELVKIRRRLRAGVYDRPPEIVEIPSSNLDHGRQPSRKNRSRPRQTPIGNR